MTSSSGTPRDSRTAWENIHLLNDWSEILSVGFCNSSLTCLPVRNADFQAAHLPDWIRKAKLRVQQSNMLPGKHWELHSSWSAGTIWLSLPGVENNTSMRSLKQDSSKTSERVGRNEARNWKWGIEKKRGKRSCWKFLLFCFLRRKKPSHRLLLQGFLHGNILNFSIQILI